MMMGKIHDESLSHMTLHFSENLLRLWHRGQVSRPLTECYKKTNKQKNDPGTTSCATLIISCITMKAIKALKLEQLLFYRSP